jgi:quercetin dioxygenase-like cupin family protein
MTLYTPSFLASGKGKPYWITEAKLTVKFSGKDTGGGYSLIELTAPEGMQIAPHTHTWEDEVFLVVSGSFRLVCDGQPFELEQGDCAFLPRGLPHWFEVTSPDFRAIEIVSPAGFENMLEDLGDLSARPHPPGSLGKEDMVRAMEVTRRYGHIIMPTAAGMPASGSAPVTVPVPDPNHPSQQRETIP